MAQASSIGFSRALALIFRVQALRFVRQLTGGLRLFGKAGGDAKRSATAGKNKQSWLFGSFVAISMLFVFSNIAYKSVINIEEAAGTALLPVSASPKQNPSAKPPAAVNVKRAAPARRVILPHAPGFAFAPSVLGALTLALGVFLLAVTLVAIGNGDLARPDWDLEWLATLPVPLSTLLSARIAVRSAVNQMGLIGLLPFTVITAWEAGYRAGAPIAGLAAALPLLVIGATVQTLCDTGLRLRLGPAQLRNVQAAIAILSILALFLAMSPGMPAKAGLITRLGPDLPAWAEWTPPGLAIRAVASTSLQSGTAAFSLLALQALFCALAGVAFLKWQLRQGIVSSGARESGRRVKVKPLLARRSSGWTLLTPIQSRELRLLGRDRTFLVQTIVMPAVIVGAQIYFNANGAALLTSAHTHPEYIASIAFGIAAYALMFSAFQILNAEGQALWILYCVPQSLESILRQKAVLWGVACLFYPALIFGVAGFAFGPVSLRLAELAAIVLLGIPIFAAIATSLGVFACDPLAQTVQRRVKLNYTYLYLLLSSTYIYSVYATNIWQRLSLLVLTALLAAALWQKARDHLPYLLDPTASPPARVSVSDGLIAALLFFVLQALVLVFELYGGGQLTGLRILIAFSIAGGVTFGMMRLAFWRLHSQGVPRTFGDGTLGAVSSGVLAGLAAAGLALIYLILARDTPLFQDVHRTLLFGNSDKALIAILAIAAAPVFEEFIFRGLIFGGLRRSLGLLPSMLASAAIFAIVHPPASVIPVFGLGLAAALVYERRKLLIAPMTAHAVYNAAVIGFQTLST